MNQNRNQKMNSLSACSASCRSSLKAIGHYAGPPACQFPSLGQGEKSFLALEETRRLTPHHQFLSAFSVVERSGFHASVGMTTPRPKRVVELAAQIAIIARLAVCFQLSAFGQWQSGGEFFDNQKNGYRPSAVGRTWFRPGRYVTYFVLHDNGTHCAFLLEDYACLNGRYAEFPTKSAVRKCQNAFGFVTG